MSKVFDARVYARVAPFWQRALVCGVGALLVVAGAIASGSFPIAESLLGVGMLVLLVAPFLLRLRNPKAAKIRVFPGKIVIVRARSFPWAIRTRTLVGACVAARGDRQVLSLSNEGRASTSPIAIEMSDAAGMKEVRKALGVRRGGFGTLTWSIRSNIFGKLETAARALAAFVLAGGWLASRLGAAGGVLSSVAGALIAFTVVMVILRFVLPAPSLSLTRSNILGDGAESGTFRAGYGNVREITETASGFALHLRDGAPIAIACPPASFTAGGLQRDERDILIAQLRGAVAATQDTPTDFSDDPMAIAQLARGNASAVDWLARIDALAQTHSNGGYRGSQISIDELWALLENHDTLTEMRSAAARFLMRATPENQHDRIAAALASIHDEDERARVRVVLDTDIQVAADDLDLLDEVARRT